jgi:hypothetical protein
VAQLQRSLEQARARFATRADEARRLVTVGDFPAEARLDAAEHAAWSTVCLLILNLDETLTRS